MYSSLLVLQAVVLQTLAMHTSITADQPCADASVRHSAYLRAL
jgi:hypothetical protein